MATRRVVTIEQLPKTTSTDQGRRFLGRVQDRMSDRRPGLVLDCSGLSNLSETDLHLLLSCLEEAMKRNGDARLASVTPSAQRMLKLIGADRLFQIFPSNTDAVNSFHQPIAGMVPIEYLLDEDSQVSENAA